MTQFTNEHEIRLHVKVLKSFYEEFCFYALICIGLVVVWLFNGGGQFWPIWIIAVWGAPLLLKASRIGIISESFYSIFNHLRHMLPIFKPEWEEQKIEQLAYMHDLRDTTPAPAQAAVSAAAPVVRPAVKKVAAKTKPAAKKAVKAVAKKAAPAKKAAAKKVVAKAAPKAAAKKVVKKAAPKKSAAKKPAAKKTAKKKK